MGLFKARYRLCFLHKIDFGFHAQGFVGAGKLKEMGKVLVKEIADIHKWFCRECETSAEEDSGRAKLARRLKSERYQQICGKDLCKAMLDWSDNSFFPSAHMLVHRHFKRTRGGHHRANSVGESSNAAEKSAGTGVKARHSIHTHAECTAARANMRRRAREQHARFLEMTEATYTDSPATGLVTPFAEEVGHLSLRQRGNYYTWIRGGDEAWTMRKTWCVTPLL